MDIQLRKKDEHDLGFLFQLFGEIKIAELNIYDWPEQMKNQLISIQHNAFEQMIKYEYPLAGDFIIIYNSENAGRLQLNKDNNSIRIINISLLSAFRNFGIGSKIIKDVLLESELTKKPVYLEVDKVNPAFNLYSRLGFKIFHRDEIKYFMKYSHPEI
jgi:ribosomal protein S18 acetylase RimI-like enzyme